MAATRTKSQSSRAKPKSSRSRSTSRAKSGSKNGGGEEKDRYRQAAEDALQQLDWAIGYLHGINKTDISKALAKNRSFIRKRLMHESEEPLPTQQTDET